MRDAIRALCAISVCCGLLMSLIPEGSGKRVFRLCCAAVLLTSILSVFKSFDFEGYSLELSRYREMGEILLEDAERQSERLKRGVVEAECERYLRDAAAALGIEGTEIELTAAWSVEGFWIPDRVQLKGSWSEDQRSRLSEVIAADLGIPEERQAWIKYGS